MAHWHTRELDETTAQAVALMTLYVGATEADDSTAADLLDEFLAAPGGPQRAIEGLQTLCAALLVLLEWETGAPPAAVLQRVGTMVAVTGQ